MKSPLSHFFVALAVCIFSLIGYGVLYNAVTDKSAIAENLQVKISQKTESIDRISSARTALSEIAGDEAAVQSYFIPETGVVAFINDIEERGRSLGTTVTILSVSIGKASTSTPQILTLAVTVKGTFDAVMRTVGAIEYAPYDLSLPSFSVGRDGENTWRADFKLAVGSVSPKTVTSTQKTTTGTSTPSP
ncbi:hypothetical protein A3A36_02620 [Candidatus Kaiserbacteria bacterium RIFCSPLOWO2_01_FULL_52_12b]|uniref:General secretion pathway protein GspM n=1 Tax=Candidatus Kaiserbacteria bacterium RIFCSPLOWO2_01_FULL_52_12b TaxID=1798509 RepID=A0A1F6EWQ5_9BACT|nr:MAG: hypothetical protein A3A36_02620 [Candidatus Kaiserbacteria bacterium RIFCSPLOWO2_01_FULL_52_12b]